MSTPTIATTSAPAAGPAASTPASGASASAGSSTGGQPAASGSASPGAAGSTSGLITSGTPAGDWTTGLNDETRGYVQNKGWKNPSDVLESYRNYEKLQGVPQDRILKLPADSNPQEMGAIYDKLGRPQNPDGYKIEVPKVGGDAELAKVMAKTFHDAGLSKSQADTVLKTWNDQLAGKSILATEAQQTKATQEVSALKKEWGAAYEVNCQMGKRAAAELGIDGAKIQQLETVLGTAATVKLFQQIGTKFGEGSFIQGNPGGTATGPMTPEQAKSRIKSNQGDPDFTQRYIQGNSKERQEMEMLHKYAYPDMG